MSSPDRASTLRQKQLYEEMHTAYTAHYYDEPSLAFRREFLITPLVAGLDLNGRQVADLACGAGFNSQLLREVFPAVEATGFDLSEPACAAYERLTGRPAHVTDLTAPWHGPAAAFDAAIVIGGLHHCVVNLPQTLENIATMLRPGGVLLMMEPSSRFWLGGVRRLWYRQDRFFDEQTERDVTHDELIGLSGEWFTVETLRYLGGPAYFAILNSLVMRVPLRAKPALVPLLFPLERAYNLFQMPSLYPIFLARWRRRSDA